MIQRVQQYYDKIAEAEWNRLTQGLSAVEYASTRRLIERHFPSAGRVVDIGSGPGRYSINLTRKGYQVTLFDLSDELLSRARREYSNLGLQPEEFVQGTATDLRQFESNTFDAALMLGPLVHLTAASERMQALSELRRVLAPGSVALLQYLNSWGLIRTGLTDFPNRYDHPASIEALLSDSTYEGTLSGFTDCYWSTPPVALAEARAAGFQIVTYAGAESFLSGMRSTLEMIKGSNSQRYETIVAIAAAMAELPQYRDSTDHLVIVIQNEKR